MFKEFFLILLLAHLLGDFYLQTDQIAEKKARNFYWILLHGLVYWIAVLIVVVPIMSNKVFLYGSISALIHLVIDILKFIYVSSKRKNKSSEPGNRLFFIDQALHLISIAIITYIFTFKGNLLYMNTTIHLVFQTLGIPARLLLSWFVAILAIHKPANIAISEILKQYKPNEKDSQSDDNKKAGRLIGTLERTIILILIFLSQYSAIGLVLTAKSIARYEKISKESDFAEYYLIGTLLSTLIVIIVAFVL